MQTLLCNWLNIKYFEEFFNDSENFVRIKQGVFSVLKDYFYISKFDVQVSFENYIENCLHSPRWIKDNKRKIYFLKRYTISYVFDNSNVNLLDKKNHMNILMSFLYLYKIKLKEIHFKIRMKDNLCFESEHYFNEPIVVQFVKINRGSLYIEIPVTDFLFSQLVQFNLGDEVSLDFTNKKMRTKLEHIVEIIV